MEECKGERIDTASLANSPEVHIFRRAPSAPSRWASGSSFRGRGWLLWDPRYRETHLLDVDQLQSNNYFTSLEAPNKISHCCLDPTEVIEWENRDRERPTVHFAHIGREKKKEGFIIVPADCKGKTEKEKPNAQGERHEKVMQKTYCGLRESNQDLNLPGPTLSPFGTTTA